MLRQNAPCPQPLRHPNLAEDRSQRHHTRVCTAAPSTIPERLLAAQDEVRPSIGAADNKTSRRLSEPETAHAAPGSTAPRRPFLRMQEPRRRLVLHPQPLQGVVVRQPLLLHLLPALDDEGYVIPPPLLHGGGDADPLVLLRLADPLQHTAQDVRRRCRGRLLAAGCYHSVPDLLRLRVIPHAHVHVGHSLQRHHALRVVRSPEIPFDVQRALERLQSARTVPGEHQSGPQVVPAAAGGQALRLSEQLQGAAVRGNCWGGEGELGVARAQVVPPRGQLLGQDLVALINLHRLRIRLRPRLVLPQRVVHRPQLVQHHRQLRVGGGHARALLRHRLHHQPASLRILEPHGLLPGQGQLAAHPGGFTAQADSPRDHHSTVSHLHAQGGATGEARQDPRPARGAGRLVDCVVVHAHRCGP
mmetsp:Transcript_56738/g.151360  ORF Transcript_56738/g.151360 Transcript_56738/m.151360 type:complete len:416 (-) Transcript_56738:304-1551(-)